MNERASSVSTVKQPFWRTTRFATVVVAIVLMAIGFYGGVQYQKKRPVPVATASQQTGPGRLGSDYGGSFGGDRGYARRSTIGSVTAISSSGVTIQPQTTGSGTKTYSITTATQITSDGQTASASDIKVGDTVMVMHSQSDTSQATRIVINPSTGSAPNNSGSPENSSPSAPTQSSI